MFDFFQNCDVFQQTVLSVINNAPLKAILKLPSHLNHDCKIGVIAVLRRGFTIRLKRLKPRAPDFGGPQNFESKDNFLHFCRHYICIFVLVQITFFNMSLTKDLYRRMSAKD